MVIIGRKIVPDEEPEPDPPKTKCFNGITQNFTRRWTISFDHQNSSNSGNKIDEDHGVVVEPSGSERKEVGKKKGGFGPLPWKLFTLSSKSLPYEGEDRFTLKSIKVATQNFNPTNKIGEGGFGPVYKGVLPDGTAIAVKELRTTSEHGISEFMNEVNIIPILRHPNVIKLLGRCKEKNNYLLVYEYMQNGNLHSALFDNHSKTRDKWWNLRERFDWATRFKICLGIAKGLAYIHDLKIVHRDFKLPNVLLDEYLNPKIADFGLAMHCEGEDHVDAIAGTWGNMAPEYFQEGIVSTKADVYGFGVVTLELMSGMHQSCVRRQSSERAVFPDLAVSLLKKGDLLTLVDEDLKTSISVEKATMVLNLAMLCLVDSPALRPTMSQVVCSLEGRTLMKTLPPLSLESYNYKYKGINSQGTAMTNISVDQLNNDFMETAVTRQGNVNESRGQEGEEVRMLIQANVATTSEVVPPILNSGSRTSSIFVDNTKMEHKGDELEYAEPHCVDPDRVTTEISVYNLSNTWIEIEETQRGNSFGDNPETGVAVISSHVASIEEENDSHNLFHGDLVSDEGELEYVEPSFDEGKHHIKCSDVDFKTGCNEWKDSLVGYFLNEKEEPFIVDKETVEKLWALKGNVCVFSMGNGYILFRFDCVEDKIRVLESSDLWHIEQRPLVLMKWNWKLKFDKSEMKYLPVWVKIYNLPLFLWSSSFFSKVGSGLGIPLYVDRKTKNRERLDYAKICIRMDANKPFPESWTISAKGVDYQLKLEYDWRPLSRCWSCCAFGDRESECRLKTKETEQN